MTDKPTYKLIKPYAGVCVKHVKTHYEITDETGTALTAVKPGTLLIELEPDKIQADNETISPSGRYFITAETIDPYHVILDVLDNTVIQYIGFPAR